MILIIFLINNRNGHIVEGIGVGRSVTSTSSLRNTCGFPRCRWVNNAWTRCLWFINNFMFGCRCVGFSHGWSLNNGLFSQELIVHVVGIIRKVLPLSCECAMPNPFFENNITRPGDLACLRDQDSENPSTFHPQ